MKQEEYLGFAKSLAYAAGDMMRKYFNQSDISHYKGDNTIVTVADEEINRMVIERVREAYPEHGVFGEESSEGTDRKYLWLCDPIDGTSMFARGVPVAVFSLALVVRGAPVVGVVYAPFADRLYTAVRGGGAHMNGERVAVNKYSLADREAAVGYDHSPTMPFDLRRPMGELNEKVRLVGLGTFVHEAMLVASGDLVAMIASGSRPYDIAAAKVIVEEAGGKVTNLRGGEQRYDGEIVGAVVSNGVVHEELVELLR